VALTLNAVFHSSSVVRKMGAAIATPALFTAP